MSNQRTGKAEITIDGQLYETKLGAKLTNWNSKTRDAVIGAKVYGYSESAAAPEIDCEFPHGTGISLQTLGNVTNSSVTFVCDSGVTFVLRNAWFASGDFTANKDGGVSCKFMGLACDELLAG